MPRSRARTEQRRAETLTGVSPWLERPSRAQQATAASRGAMSELVNEATDALAATSLGDAPAAYAWDRAQHPLTLVQPYQGARPTAFSS